MLETWAAQGGGREHQPKEVAWAAMAQWRTLERVNKAVGEREILLSSAGQPAGQNTCTHADYYHIYMLPGIIHVGTAGSQAAQELIHVCV